MGKTDRDLVNDLRRQFPAVGSQVDLTTLLSRKIAQSVQAGTSSPGATSPWDGTLYDGDDIQEEVRNYIRDVSDW